MKSLIPKLLLLVLVAAAAAAAWLLPFDCYGQSTHPSPPPSPGAQSVISAVEEYDATAQQTLSDAHTETQQAQQTADQYRQQRDALQDQLEAVQTQLAALQATTRPTSQPATQPIIAKPNFASTQPYAFVQDARGWTILPTPLHGLYIDTLKGNDANPGTLAAPVKTQDGAFKRAVAGDAIYYPRGQTVAGTGTWLTKDYAQLLAYGVGPAPVIKPAANSPGLHVKANNVYIGGINFIGDQASTKGLELDGSGHRVEGCSLTRHNQSLVVSAGTGVTIYRSNLSRNFKTVANGPGYAQGAYADGAKDLLFDSCVFAYNGWDGKNPATADVHQHGIYEHCGTPVNFSTFRTRNCFVAENGSNGIMGRNPGTHEDDFFLDDGIHGSDLVAGGPASYVRRCVFTGALDAPARATQRAHGLELDSQNGEATDNLIVNSQGPRGAAIEISFVDYNKLDMTTGRLLIARNVIRGWIGIGIQFDADRQLVTLDSNQVGITPGGWTVNYRVPPKQGIVSTNNSWNPGPIFRYAKQDLSAASWKALVNDQPAVAPAATTWSATVEGYAASTLGAGAGGEALIQRVEANSPDNWDDRFTASAINAYMRAGH